jgi:hypothetical protein
LQTRLNGPKIPAAEKRFSLYGIAVDRESGIGAKGVDIGAVDIGVVESRTSIGSSTLAPRPPLVDEPFKPDRVSPPCRPIELQ